MSSLYIDRQGVVLKVDGEALVFYENNLRTGTVPLAPISRVLVGGDVQLNARTLAKFGEKGIGVVVISKRTTPAIMLGSPHNDARLRMAQYQLFNNHELCLKFAKELIEEKTLKQFLFINEVRSKYLGLSYPLSKCLQKLESALENIDKQQNIAQLRGIEGAAAASYFEGYTQLFAESLKFKNRNRRPPKDPVNSILSLSYTILHSEVVLGLYASGFDPYIGFYHTLHFGRESLACDLVEPMRTDVDQFVLKLFKTGVMRVEDFSTTDKGCFMGKAGRARFYAEWEKKAESIRKELQVAITKYAEKIRSYAKLPITEDYDEID